MSTVENMVSALHHLSPRCRGCGGRRGKGANVSQVSISVVALEMTHLAAVISIIHKKGNSHSPKVHLHEHREMLVQESLLTFVLLEAKSFDYKISVHKKYINRTD